LGILDDEETSLIGENADAGKFHISNEAKQYIKSIGKNAEDIPEDQTALNYEADGEILKEDYEYAMMPEHQRKESNLFLMPQPE
jgi:hypothetical protein